MMLFNLRISYQYVMILILNTENWRKIWSQIIDLTTDLIPLFCVIHKLSPHISTSKIFVSQFLKCLYFSLPIHFEAEFGWYGKWDAYVTADLMMWHYLGMFYLTIKFHFINIYINLYHKVTKFDAKQYVWGFSLNKSVIIWISSTQFSQKYLTCHIIQIQPQNQPQMHWWGKWHIFWKLRDQIG
jgi:hypothetical protein